MMGERRYRMDGMPVIKVMMMPRDTNPYGIIFGGVILSYIDQAGAVEALQYAAQTTPHGGYVKFVTVAMEKIEFHEPVMVGDILSFFAKPTKVGKSSIEISIEVTASRFASGLNRDVRVTNAIVTYVSVDENRKAFPVFDGTQMEKYHIVIKKENRDKKIDLAANLNNMPGVLVIGKFGDHGVQIKATNDAIQKLRDLLTDQCHIEEDIPHTLQE